MRFEALKAEFKNLHQQSERLDRAREREYVVGEGADRLRVSLRVCFLGDEAVSYVSVSRWHSQPGSTYSMGGKEYQGGYFDHVHDPLSSLSSQQLALVTACKRFGERYIAGEIEALPVDPPTSF